MTKAIEQHPRAWAVLVFDRDLALVGVHLQWECVAPLASGALADALDAWLARPSVFGDTGSPDSLNA